MTTAGPNDRQRAARPAPILGVVAVLVGAALFATLPIIARTVYAAGMVPLSFVAWRAGIGAVAALGFGLWLARRRPAAPGVRRVDARQRAMLAVATLSALTLNLAMFFAFDLVPVAIALLCFYTYPALVAGVGVVTGREPLDGPRAAALVLAIAGMIGVVAGGLSGTDPAAIAPLGVGLAFGAAASQTVFVVVSRDGYRGVPTDQAMGLILLGTALVAAALGFASDGGSALRLPLEQPDLLPLVVIAGVFGAAIPSLLFLGGIRLIGGLRTGILMLFEPVVAVVLAAALLAEAVTLVQLAGGAAILLAAALLQRAGSPEARPSLLDDEEAAALHAPGGP